MHFSSILLGGSDVNKSHFISWKRKTSSGSRSSSSARRSTRALKIPREARQGSVSLRVSESGSITGGIPGWNATELYASIRSHICNDDTSSGTRQAKTDSHKMDFFFTLRDFLFSFLDALLSGIILLDSLSSSDPN